jgi:hypothetical protein
LFCNIVQLFVFFIEFDFLYAIKPIWTNFEQYINNNMVLHSLEIIS